MHWSLQKLHRDLAPTTLYAYGQSAATASFPGPTLEASQGTASNLNYENHIPDATHFLPLDRTIHWANPTLGGVPTVTHLHGAEVQSFFDGHPDAWFTQYNEHGRAYSTQSYTYPNTQSTTMLWYHDHTVGITRLNVLAGLTGIYFLRSSQEQQLTNMFTPGKYEIPFLIKDVQFWANGSINFPSIGDSPTNHPQWCPEYFGDTILVNGKAWPYLNITARWYRLRLLNGANARFFNLTLSNPNLSFIKIGTDGGFLDQPQTVSSLLIAPAERIDCLIDFSSLHPGDTVFVNNSAAAPFPSGNPAFSPPQTSSVAMFRVVTPPLSAFAAQSRSSVMNVVSNAVGNNNSPSISYTNALHRYLVLQEFDDAAGNPVVSTLGNKTWTDPATELPKEGAVEVWELINTTPDAHPIHVHLIQFTVLSSQPYDVAGYVRRCIHRAIHYVLIVGDIEVERESWERLTPPNYTERSHTSWWSTSHLVVHLRI